MASGSCGTEPLLDFVQDMALKLLRVDERRRTQTGEGDGANDKRRFGGENWKCVEMRCGWGRAWTADCMIRIIYTVRKDRVWVREESFDVAGGISG